MKRALLLLSVMAVTSVSALDFPLAGFQIDSLDVPRGEVPTSPLVMCLPPSDGFAPNVNVTIQPFPGTLGDYVTVSLEEFEQVKWTVLNNKREGDTSWSVEYLDPNPQNPLHFYARAVASGKYIYLVTATARESQWKSVETQLRKCVDSFKVKPEARKKN